MSSNVEIGKRDEARIDRAISRYVEQKHIFESLAKSLVGHLTADPVLGKFIHFIKWRVKDETSLKDKLRRKIIENKNLSGKQHIEPIDESNIFERVVDLAGVRILHLNTEQLREMHGLILGVLHEHKYALKDEPLAHCWDIEYESLFDEFGIRTISRDSMYTTVHYDVVANQRTKLTCELQVRSLMDEVWGEVSHRVNYPNESLSMSCRDQLKVLARLTTGGTRLVDSIIKTHNLDSVRRD